ncbi:hypothetical protein K8R43_05980 [archaeon]|nr:hypothetical protein [archaeon]
MKYSGDPNLNKYQLYKKLTPLSKQKFEKILEKVLINWHKNRKATTTHELHRYGMLNYTENKKQKHIGASATLKKILPYIPTQAAFFFGTKDTQHTSILHQNMITILIQKKTLRKSTNLPIKQRLANLNKEDPPSHYKQAALCPITELENVYTHEVIHTFTHNQRKIKQERLNEWALSKKAKTYDPIRKWEHNKLKELKIKPRVLKPKKA